MNRNEHGALDRYDAWLSGLIFLLALALYIRTLTPGLLPGDSGEFQTLALLLGDTHPTGYPVYLTLARLVLFLPLHDIAWRVNLFSAMMGALAVAGLYLAARMLIRYRLLALMGALMLAISPTFWSQAIIAEVYAPGAAFLILILALLLWWDQHPARWALFTAGMLGGLSLGVHMTVALVAPAVLLFLALHWRRGRRMWMTALAGAAAGLLLSLLLFWMIDWHNPPANYFHAIIEPSLSAWGLTPADLNSPWERLWFGWSAQQFRPFMFQAEVFGQQADQFWQGLPAELGAVTPWLALVGGIYLLWRRPRAGLLLLTALALELLFVFTYAIWDLYVFFIPGYLLISLLAVIGLAAAIDAIDWMGNRFAQGGAPTWLTGAAQGLLAILLLALVVWPTFQPQMEAVVAGDIPFDFDEYPAYDPQLLPLAQLTVAKLPANAILFTDWDQVWPYFYAAHIVEDRRDLLFVETHPRDDVPGLAHSVIDYINARMDAHPIFFAEREPELRQAGFRLRPVKVGPQRFYLVEKP